MFDTIFGLPMHVLVNHAVVVLVPLTALAALTYVLVPRWRWTLFWPLLAGAPVSLGSAFATWRSGLALYDRLGQPSGEQILQHRDLGTWLFWIVLAFALVIVVALLLLPCPRPEGLVRAARIRTGRKGGPSSVQAVVAILLLAAALLAGYQVIVTGDAGARSTWEGRVTD